MGEIEGGGEDITGILREEGRVSWGILREEGRVSRRILREEGRRGGGTLSANSSCTKAPTPSFTSITGGREAELGTVH